MCSRGGRLLVSLDFLFEGGWGWGGVGREGRATGHASVFDERDQGWGGKMQAGKELWAGSLWR